MVREVTSDSPHGADGPRVEDGRSIFRGVLLELREPISRSQPLARGWSRIVLSGHCRLPKSFAS
jgi:hypothetical protein